jgi:hypothetical protein
VICILLYRRALNRLRLEADKGDEGAAPLATDPTHVGAADRLTPEAAAAYVGELFEQHGRMVYGLCRLLLRDGVGRALTKRRGAGRS